MTTETPYQTRTILPTRDEKPSVEYRTIDSVDFKVVPVSRWRITGWVFRVLFVLLVGSAIVIGLYHFVQGILAFFLAHRAVIIGITVAAAMLHLSAAGCVWIAKNKEKIR